MVDKKYFSLLISGMLLVTGGAAQAAIQRIVCPAELPMTALQITSPPSGWHGFVPHEAVPGLALVDAGVMYGPPAEMAESKPDDDSAAGLRWSRIKAPADGVWMACYYGEGRLMILAQRLADKTTGCTILPQAPAGKQLKLDIACR